MWFTLSSLIYLGTYFGLKFISNMSAGLVPFINSFVHTIMYLYYALAAMRIRVWWKKYLTQLQVSWWLLTNQCEWCFIFRIRLFFKFKIQNLNKYLCVFSRFRWVNWWWSPSIHSTFRCSLHAIYIHPISHIQSDFSVLCYLVCLRTSSIKPTSKTHHHHLQPISILQTGAAQTNTHL